jgi:hypothetical protein
MNWWQGVSEDFYDLPHVGLAARRTHISGREMYAILSARLTLTIRSLVYRAESWLRGGDKPQTEAWE